MWMGIRIFTEEGPAIRGDRKTVSNSVIYSNDFSRETTGQMLMKLAHNDKSVMGIQSFTYGYINIIT